MSRLIWIYAVWQSVFQLYVWTTSFLAIVCEKKADDKYRLKFDTERVKTARSFDITEKESKWQSALNDSGQSAQML